MMARPRLEGAAVGAIAAATAYRLASIYAGPDLGRARPGRAMSAGSDQEPAGTSPSTAAALSRRPGRW
jgi:hypothetical protein